jgi:alcohol dehydrogenase class IV
MIDFFHWGSTKVYIGPQSFNSLYKLLEEERKKRDLKIFLLLGKKSFRESKYFKELENYLSSINSTQLYEVASYPSFKICEDAKEALLASKANIIIAIGGGSVIDTAKIANAAAGLNCRVSELFTPQKKIKTHANIFVAIPTAAGSGCEITPYATLWGYESLKKYSLESPHIVPTHTYIDASLMCGLPLDITYTAIVDALGHALESIWSKRSTIFTDALAIKAIKLILKYAPSLRHSPDNIYLRSQLCWASLLAGMAISNTRTAAAHAISYILTLKYNIPHGKAVAVLLPSVFKVNLPALEKEKISMLLECFGVTDPIHLPGELEKFIKNNNMTSTLSFFGVKESDVSYIASHSLVPGRMDNNVLNLEPEDIINIVRHSL